MVFIIISDIAASTFNRKVPQPLGSVQTGSISIRFTFEATNVLDAVPGTMDTGTILRLNVGRIKTFEPFATLEW